MPKPLVHAGKVKELEVERDGLKKVVSELTEKRDAANGALADAQATVLGKAEPLSKANDSIKDLKLKLEGLEKTLTEAKAREAEEAKKNKTKQKALDEAEAAKIPPEVREASRSGMRQYARGRAYDPKRFGEVTSYDEGAIEAMFRAQEEAEQGKKKKKKDKNED